MSWRTNSVVLKLRNAGRAAGINRMLAPILYGRSFEASYDKGFSRRLRKGDFVWDVGANVGYYTHSFSQIVGDDGAVYAFEPSSDNFSNLRERCSELRNVILIQIGLGDKECRLRLLQGEDELGTTSRISFGSTEGEVVEIRPGDRLVTDGIARRPDAIKIDVEGFELEVLTGMQNAIETARVIGVEIHFRILEERGASNAPGEIERLLRSHGFAVSWPDNSHIIAERIA